MPKRIFAVLYVSVMGLTRCYKTTVFFTFIISYTTVISVAYLASLDLSGTLGIIIYFLRRKYPACKAAKGLTLISVQRWHFGQVEQWLQLLHLNLLQDQHYNCLSLPICGPNSNLNTPNSPLENSLLLVSTPCSVVLKFTVFWAIG